MRRPARPLAALALAALAAVALPALPVVAGPAPTGAALAEPTLAGRVLEPDGRPGSGLLVQVSTRRAPGAAGAPAAVPAPPPLDGALLACWAQRRDAEPCVVADAVAVRSGDDGRWAVPVPAGAGDYDVVVARPGADGPTPVLTTRVAVTGDTALPTLRPWATEVTAAPRDGDVVVDWQPLPAGTTGRPPAYAVVLEPDRADAPTAVPAVTATRGRVDGRLLEDAPGQAVPVATGEVRGLPVTWFAPRVAYPAVSGPPLTRGRPCTATGAGVPEAARAACWTGDGRVVPLVASPDGPDPLGRPLLCRPPAPPAEGPLTCGRPAVTEVVVDLGGVPQPLGTVVVRGCPAVCEVDTAPDGRTWSPAVATGAGPGQAAGPLRGTPLAAGGTGSAVALPEGTVARYVRIRPAGAAAPFERPVPAVPDGARVLTAEEARSVPRAAVPGDLALLQEVSVFPPRPQRPPTPAPAAAVDGLPALPVTAAALLLLALAGAWSAAARAVRR